MVQFLAPETDIMGEQNYIIVLYSIYSIQPVLLLYIHFLGADENIYI